MEGSHCEFKRHVWFQYNSLPQAITDQEVLQRELVYILACVKNGWIYTILSVCGKARARSWDSFKPCSGTTITAM